MAHDPQKLAYWTQHFQRWYASGLSQRAYCQREGLSFSSFDRWRAARPPSPALQSEVATRNG